MTYRKIVVSWVPTKISAKLAQICKPKYRHMRLKNDWTHNFARFSIKLMYYSICTIKLHYFTIYRLLYLAHKNLADSDPVIMPYKVVNIRFMPLYGVITGSLSADYSCARNKLLCYSWAVVKMWPNSIKTSVHIV